MNDQDKTCILKQAKNAFIKAMLAGYISDSADKKVIRISSRNGAEQMFTYEDEEMKVVDHRLIAQTSRFFVGTTTVFIDDVPIWWMSFGGRYPKEITDFLKRALKAQYESGSFRGGRGSIRYSDNEFTYSNTLDGIENSDLSLENFSGREEITDKDGNVLGFLNYSGMSLL